VGGKGRGRGQGGEMTRALYAHMNKIKIKKRENLRGTWGSASLSMRIKE
jgi:hypothetical protein